MGFCTECGARNEAGVRFCITCGARLESLALQSTTLNGVSASLAGLSVGEMFVLGGAGLVILSFFLPWFTEPPEFRGFFGGMGGFRRPESLSGLGLFNLLGASVLLVPLLAVIAAVLVLLARQASQRTRFQVSGWQILLAAPATADGFMMLFMPVIPTILSVGFYGVILGNLGILIGSFLLLHQLAQVPARS
jgi:zinc-ribbon domain